MNSLIEKVKELLTKPAEFLVKAKDEQTTLKELIMGYVIFLAAIPAIGNFIGYAVIGRSIFGHIVRYPMKYALPHAILWYAASVALVIGVVFITQKLSTNFGGSGDIDVAARAIVYSYTPAWVAGVFYIIPALSVIAMIAGFYSLYLLWISTDKVLDIPENKRMTFMIVLVIAVILVGLLTGVIAGLALPNIPGL
ncbi:MAG: YIP1 family protein [Candidatus Aegiribacteria sp.]|nr:YIP1 family protein [Candidatus Aegiribacteria sp.]